MSYLKKAITKALRDSGKNVTLDKIESKKEYKVVKSVLANVLMLQATSFSNETIEQASQFVVKSSDANPLMISFLKRVMPSFLPTYENEAGSDFGVYMEWVANESGAITLDRMFGSSDFNLTNEVVLSRIEKQKNLIVDTLDQTTLEDVAGYIEEGTRGMLTSSEIADLIHEKYSNISTVRADMIAQTETANISNLIEYEMYKKAGVKSVKWLTVLDDRVSKRDRALHAQEQPIGQEFVSSYDGWAGTRPPSHPRCRCYLNEVMDNIDVRFLRAWNGE